MRTVLIVFVFIHASVLAGQTVSPVDRQQLLDLLDEQNDTIYVVNFWATWCSPCVKEIGYFEELSDDYAGRPLQVILVNLDFPNQVNRRVIPFLQERNMDSRVVNMTDLDYNKWISKVDTSWSGAIPATLIYHGNSRTFIGGEVTREELYGTVETYF